MNTFDLVTEEMNEWQRKEGRNPYPWLHESENTLFFSHVYIFTKSSKWTIMCGLKSVFGELPDSNYVVFALYIFM